MGTKDPRARICSEGGSRVVIEVGVSSGGRTVPWLEAIPYRLNSRPDPTSVTASKFKARSTAVERGHFDRR